MTILRYLSSLGEAVAALNESRNFFYPLRHGTSDVDPQRSSRTASALQ